MSNRELLLERALQLFGERGYDAVGVQEICTAAGVTKPTLYHYFGSKAGVLQSLVQERYAPFAPDLERAASYAGDLPKTLEQVVRAFFRFAEQEPTFYRLMLALWFGSRSSEAGQIIARVHAEQGQLLREMFVLAGRDHGSIRGRERTYATTLLGMIHTHVGLALNGEIQLSAEVAHRAVHQFSHGIYS